MTVPPTRRTVLLGLLGITLFAAGLRWWMVAHTAMPSRDCLIFVRIALQLYDPPKSRFDAVRQLDGPADVLRETDQPPGYPLAILGAATLLRNDLDTATGDQMVFAAQLVSAVCGVLLTFPLFGVASRLFGPAVGLLACLWFQLLPVFTEVTSDGLSDGLFLLTAAGAMWFGLNVLNRQKWYGGLSHGVLAGVCVGAGYLVRPDSLIVGGAIGCVLAGTCVARWKRRERGLPVFLGGVGLAVATAALMYPYVSIIGKLTNKPSLSDAQAAAPAVSIPLAAWRDADAVGSKEVWAAKALGTEVLKGTHYLLPFFALAGILRARKRWGEAEILLPLAVLLLHLGVLWYLAVRAGYVSQRHTLLTGMVGAVFAASALPCAGALGVRLFRIGSPSLWTGLWVLLIAGLCLPRDFHSLHADRAGHRAAGEWLAREGNPHFSVVDPFGWAEFYSGRTVRGWTTANPIRRPFVYTVLEPNAASPHSRLPWLADANKLAARGEVVFQYPPDVPPDRIKVAVYRSPPLQFAESEEGIRRANGAVP